MSSASQKKRQIPRSSCDSSPRPQKNRAPRCRRGPANRKMPGLGTGSTEGGCSGGQADEGRVIYKTGDNRLGRFPEAASDDLVADPKRNFQIFDPRDFLAACPAAASERRRKMTQHPPSPERASARQASRGRETTKSGITDGIRTCLRQGFGRQARSGGKRPRRNHRHRRGASRRPAPQRPRGPQTLGRVDQSPFLIVFPEFSLDPIHPKIYRGGTLRNRKPISYQELSRAGQVGRFQGGA